MLTFLLTGRPAGREGAASMQSGKCFLDAEAATDFNPTGTYKVGASLQIGKDRGLLSRQKKKPSGDVRKQKQQHAQRRQKMDVMRTKQKNT